MHLTKKVLAALVGSNLALLLSFTLSIPAQAELPAFVVNRAEGTVSAVDSDTKLILAEIDVEGRPKAAAYSPDGQFVYVSLGGAGGGVAIISVAGLSLDATMLTGNGAASIAVTPGGEFAFVTTRFTGLDVYDLVSRTFLLSVPNSSLDTPQEIAITPFGFSYVANIAFQGSPNSGIENVTVFDNNLLVEVDAVDVSAFVNNFGPWGVTALPGGKRVYSNDGDNGENVFEIDSDPSSPTFNELLDVIPVSNSSGGPRGMESGTTPLGVRVYAALSEDEEIVAIDPSTNLIVARIPTGRRTNPIRSRLNPAGTELWVALRSAGEVLVLDTVKMETDPANAEITRITGFSGPNDIAFTRETVIEVDHFKCYEAEGDELDVTVDLEDQFGVEPQVLVEEPELFCNPVDKNGEGIGDPTAHLTAYEIEDDGEEVERVVVVANQFGEQILEVGEPELLFVPSEKDGVPSTLNLDHFKCYEAEGDEVDVTVSLEDQFGAEPGVLVGEPELFCNPVDKNGEGINNPEAHLTCYEIEDDEEVERVVVVANQFGEQILEVEEPELLCVPSEKLSVQQLDNGEDDDDDDDD